jgi:hypothetical protein
MDKKALRAPPVMTTQALVKAFNEEDTLTAPANDAKMYLPEQARKIFDDLIVLRPRNFWTEPYLRQLAQLSEAMYLITKYQEMEVKAAKKMDLNACSRLSKVIGTKATLVRMLQSTLQLTPTDIRGNARENNKTLKQDNIIREIRDDDPDDLYV